MIKAIFNFIALVALVLLGTPYAAEAIDNYRCNNDQIRCTLEEPDVMFRTKDYPSGFEFAEFAFNTVKENFNA